MKVAILGGTGFMGYDFVRTLLESGTATPVVYCTSPKSLVNLGRHDVEVRMVPSALLANEVLDDDTEFLVNFAHPFAMRDGLTPDQQIGNLCEFMRMNLLRSPGLKLIHMSSMSVYEPFAPRVQFSEDAPLHPPKTDAYARAKVRIERELGSIPDTADRQLILRPTIVFGPYCRPWTDALLEVFAGGDVQYHDLGGTIQPIYVNDVSRFVIARLNDFKAGIYNLGGPTVLHWKDFLNFFAGIVGKGTLVHNPDGAEADARGERERTGGSSGAYWANVGELVRVCARQPSFNNLVSPVTHRFPMSFRRRIHRIFGIDSHSGASTKQVEAVKDPPGPFCKHFFAQDRLVETEKAQGEFAKSSPSSLESVRGALRDYYLYRFTDAIFD